MMIVALLPLRPVLGADDLQQWSSLLMIKRLDEDWTGTFLVQGRFNEDISNAQVLLIRPEVGYNLSKETQSSLGFDYFDRLDRGRPTEYRVWQQPGIGQDWDKVAVTNRLRIEQRFIDGVDGPVVRTRYRLSGQGWLDDEKRRLLYASNEVFFNLNQEAGGPPVGFNQNRLQSGVGYRIVGGLRLEAGHQWTAARDSNALVLILTFRVDLDRLGSGE